MEQAKKFLISQSEDRFRFEIERHILNRVIEGVEVTKEGVSLSLSGNKFIRFKVDGPNIMVSVPDVPEGPTLDMETGGPVQ